MTFMETIAETIAAGPAQWLPPLPAELPDAPALSGLVPLDPVAAELFGADRIDFDDHNRRREFTAILITVGMPATIHAYLSIGQLQADWHELDLAGPVRSRWQARFPELAR